MRAESAGRILACAFGLVVAILAVVPASAQATVWVNDCAGVGTGTQGDPYCKIQTAICDIMDTGGTINVLPGTYFEAIRVPANIAIVSTDGPAVTTLNATGKPCPTSNFCTIGAEPNCSAVYFPSAAGTTSRIEGIRITNTNGGKDQPGFEGKIGAGILVYGSSPTITRNEIVGNTISHPSFQLFYGGGIYINAVNPAAPARPVITNNLIQGNVADPPNGSPSNLSYGYGGGVYVGYNASAVITSNTIKLNRVGDPQKTNMNSAGGGVAAFSRVTVQETIVRGNLVTGNNAGGSGGGISLGEYIPESGPTQPSRGTIDNNVLESNVANFGAAIDMGDTFAKIYNNTIHDNAARVNAGGVYFGEPTTATHVAEFVNNLVTSNQATPGAGVGGGFYVDPDTNPTVRFNDIWANTPTNVAGSKTDASYIGVNGGISVDPLYVDRNAVPPNLRLLSTSPVVEVGDNTVATVPTDHDGAPRVQDKDYNGVATVDMGAFEFAPDFDGDGTPDWQDPDQDDDGVANALDCAPVSRAITQVPDRVAHSLRVNRAGPNATLKWLHAFQAPTYNVYRGTLGGGAAFAYNETCFDTENPARTVVDGAQPAPGGGFYYIIGGRNSCGESAAVTNHQGQHHTPVPTCGTANRNGDADTPRDNGDNCPSMTNGSQGDVDADSQGDACDNCPSSANVDQADLDGDALGDVCDPDIDGDGVPNGQDCQPFDGSLSAPAVEVTNVVLAQGATTSLSWGIQAGSDSYDVVGGVLSTLRSIGSPSDASCLFNDVVFPAWNDPRPDPVASDGYYYLVRGANNCGGGTYGAASGGAERIPGSPCP